MKAIVVLGFVGLTLAAPSIASASSISFVGEGKVGVVSIHSPGLGDLTVYAGELNWSWIGPPPNGLPADFYSYCVDVNNWVRNTQDVTRLSTDVLLTGAVDAGPKAAWLVNTYAPQIHSDPLKTGIDAAALQVAIWEILYDSSPDLFTGNFFLRSTLPTADVVIKANALLSSLFYLPGDFSTYRTSETHWLDAPLRLGQDQIVPNPEPGSMILFGSGLVALARFVRRRRRVR